MQAISLDLDGVVAIWPFGLNPGVSGRVRAVPELPPGFERAYDEGFRAPSRARLAVEWLRFAWRRPDPEAAAVLSALSEKRRVVLTTGRSEAGRPALLRWLRRHRLEPFVHDVHMSPRGLSNRQHKLASLKLSGIDEHVDDDPGTIWYLAQHGIRHLYLRSWPHTDQVRLPPSATAIRRLGRLLDRVD